MTDFKECGWCQKMVDPEKCFADKVPEHGWLCAICGEIVDSPAAFEGEERRNLSQP
jgi:hypothetical protein